MALTTGHSDIYNCKLFPKEKCKISDFYIFYYFNAPGNFFIHCLQCDIQLPQSLKFKQLILFLFFKKKTSSLKAHLLHFLSKAVEISQHQMLAGILSWASAMEERDMWLRAQGKKKTTWST